MTIILFIIILAGLILIHELGHFLTAKWAGIRVDEFGLGLPPRAYGFKIGETIYSLNWLPFGGFVKIFGEDPNEESLTGPDSARSFVRQPKIKQALVLVAGVSFNLILAWLLISLNLSLGMPVGLEGLPSGLQVENRALALVSLSKDLPAEQAGLKIGDHLVSLSSEQEKISNLAPETVRSFVASRSGKEIVVEYRRAGELAQLRLSPTGKSSESGVIGVAMQEIGLVRATWWQAPFYGLYFTYYLISNILSSFVYLFKTLFVDAGTVLSSVAGPVGIYGLMSDASRLGLVYLFNFTAMISVNLAILNLLPFPALDGGRLLFVAIEAVSRRPIKPVIANTLNLIGFSLLILLMLVVAINDITRLF